MVCAGKALLEAGGREGHRRQEGPLAVLPASSSLSEGGGGGVRMLKSRSLDSNAN